MPTVLVIDDNPSVATALEVLFSLQDIHTLGAASPAEGLAVLESTEVDLVVQDMNFTADTTSGEEGVARSTKRAKDQVPLGRPGRLREVGLLALYLASAASDFMTGQTIFLDGGHSAA